MSFRLTFCIPVATQTESNSGGHWSGKWKRGENQKKTTRLAWLASAKSETTKRGLPSYVTLMRYGLGRLDGDNLQSSMKHVRDELAVCLGLTPLVAEGKKKGHPAYGVGDDKIEWRYDQAVTKKRTFVEVSLTWE